MLLSLVTGASCSVLISTDCMSIIKDHKIDQEAHPFLIDEIGWFINLSEFVTLKYCS